MLSLLANLDLWDILVSTLFGSFLITILVVSLGLYLIMIYFGGMSSLSSIFVVLLYVLLMGIGYGDKYLAVLILIVCIAFFFYQWKAWTS
jgi:hypothetical protein